MPICPGGQIYVIQAGDTLYFIARRFNIPVNVLLMANPGIDPYNLMIGQQICIPVPPTVTCPNGSIRYTIKAGDTLYNIAAAYNTTVEAIMSLNPGLDPYNLMIGQIICVPEAPPVPEPGPEIVTLNPTDITPNSKGVAFIESDAVTAFVTNVPRPDELPDGEVYKLWVRESGNGQQVVSTMEEIFPGYWGGRVQVNFSLTTGVSILITSEQEENTTAPAGLGVAEKIL